MPYDWERKWNEDRVPTGPCSNRRCPFREGEEVTAGKCQLEDCPRFPVRPVTAVS